MFTRTLAIALLALTPTFAPNRSIAQSEGSAQPQAEPVDAKATDTNVDLEAEKALEAANNAVTKIRDITYTVTCVGGMGGETPVTGKLSVSIPENVEVDSMVIFDRYRFALLDDGGKPTVEWANNGKVISKINHAEKKFFSMELEDGHEVVPDDFWRIFPQWLIEDRMQNPMLKTVTLTVGEDEEVNGVQCRKLAHVQEVSMPDDGKMVLTRIKYLSPKDWLPRKLETSVQAVGMEDGPDMKMATELSDLETNIGLKDSDFVLKAPAGYTSEAGTLDNMGLPTPMAEPPPLKAEVGKPALDFALTDSTGKVVTLESLKGRVVLLDFWATWCGPCRAAMPSIQKLHEQFAAEPVTIIGVNCMEDKPEAAVKYMKKKEYTYTLLLNGDDLAEGYAISGIPTFILIGKDGNVLHAAVGFEPGEGEHLAELIQTELDRK